MAEPYRSRIDARKSFHSAMMLIFVGLAKQELTGLAACGSPPAIVSSRSGAGLMFRRELRFFDLLGKVRDPFLRDGRPTLGIKRAFGAADH